VTSALSPHAATVATAAAPADNTTVDRRKTRRVGLHPVEPGDSADLTTSIEFRTSLTVTGSHSASRAGQGKTLPVRGGSHALPTEQVGETVPAGR
jgi:hypothetical protein